MKLLVLGIVITWQFSPVVPRAMCQANEPAKQILHLLKGTPQGAGVNLAALNIQWAAPTLTSTASLIELKGNVEIRTCCVVAPDQKQNAQRQYVVLRADEAEYDAGTGEIEARGNVHVKLEPAK